MAAWTRSFLTSKSQIRCCHKEALCAIKMFPGWPLNTVSTLGHPWTDATHAQLSSVVMAERSSRLTARQLLSRTHSLGPEVQKRNDMFRTTTTSNFWLEPASDHRCDGSRVHRTWATLSVGPASAAPLHDLTPTFQLQSNHPPEQKLATPSNTGAHLVGLGHVVDEVEALRDGNLGLATHVLPLGHQLLPVAEGEGPQVGHSGRPNQRVAHQALQLAVQHLHWLQPPHLHTSHKTAATLQAFTMSLQHLHTSHKMGATLQAFTCSLQHLHTSHKMGATLQAFTCSLQDLHTPHKTCATLCLYMIWACFLQHLHTSHKMYATLQVHALYSTYTKSHKCLCFTHITKNVHYITGACSLQHLNKTTQNDCVLYYRRLFFTAPTQNHTKWLHFNKKETKRNKKKQKQTQIIW